MWREAAIATVALASACGSRGLPETRTVAIGGSEVEIGEVIEAALQADGRGEAAESLYAPYATVVADGRRKRMAPRFAGVSENGEVAITSTQVQSRGTAGWGDLEYRWVSDRSNRVQVGRASFVLTPATGRPGWWIVQLHSSTAK